MSESSNATHKDKHGTLYRREGNYWRVWRSNDWWVISGEPTQKLERIK